MLVLARRPDETLILRVPNLAEPIRVLVVGVRGSKVSLGVEAPREVTIDRSEVDERRQLEKRGSK